MLFGAVADHGIGGVDRLVGGASSQPADAQPEGRRHNAVGKILGEAFDGGTAHTRFVQPVRVAPDDLRNGDAPGLEAAGLQRLRHRRDVAFEAVLRQQTGRHDSRKDDAER